MKQKHKNANKQTKTKSVLKNIQGGGKSLILLFAFLCFLCMRRKDNRKKKIEKREKSQQGNVNALGSLSMQI